MTRPVRHRYDDPLDLIWTGCARRCGFRVERSDDVYASTDGAGTLYIGRSDTLDVDDCLAQMIFHELCHALVQGDDGVGRPDWGLDNRTDLDEDREHACLRLQALLADRHGLRGFLAPTTDFRAFYDALGHDPLADADPSTRAVVEAAAQRADSGPFAPDLTDALHATALIVISARRFLDESPPGAARSLYQLAPPGDEATWCEEDIVAYARLHPERLPRDHFVGFGPVSPDWAALSHARSGSSRSRRWRRSFVLYLLTDAGDYVDHHQFETPRIALDQASSTYAIARPDWTRCRVRVLDGSEGSAHVIAWAEVAGEPGSVDDTSR